MAAETMTVHAVPVFCYNCQKVPVALAESHEKNGEVSAVATMTKCMLRFVSN